MAPVHSAADRGSSTIVQMLLDKGARADLVDNVSIIANKNWQGYDITGNCYISM